MELSPVQPNVELPLVSTAINNIQRGVSQSETPLKKENGFSALKNEYRNPCNSNAELFRWMSFLGHLSSFSRCRKLGTSLFFEVRPAIGCLARFCRSEDS